MVPFFSHHDDSNFLASPLGGDVEEICIFQKEKYVHMVPFFGKRGNESCMVIKHFIKDILMKMANLKKGNQSCMYTELHMGAILTKMTILKCGN